MAVFWGQASQDICSGTQRHMVLCFRKVYMKIGECNAEMKLLRPLAGYALYDHKTNDSIRREQTDNILDKIDEYRRNWLLYLQRMPQNRIPLKSFHYSPQEKRTIGRPKKRWREQL
jgi:hypothetical protein